MKRESAQRQLASNASVGVEGGWTSSQVKGRAHRCNALPSKTGLGATEKVKYHDLPYPEWRKDLRY